MKILLTVLVFAFAATAQAANCTGYKEYLENGQLQVDSVDLTVEYQSAQATKISADIDEVHYMSLQRGENNYLLMITLGPNYTSGVTAGLTWDENGSMRISRVDGNDVYRLVCTK